mgnify:CR=1 FL=1
MLYLVRSRRSKENTLMARHRRRIAIALAVVALPLIFVLWSYHTLRSYQEFIHHQYAPEIRQLEIAMQQWPEDRLEDEAAYQLAEALKEELKKTFRSGDFYSASWSFDSHHGAQSTGLPSSGFTTYPWVSTTDNFRQTLYFGRSFEGVPLLVYQRWLSGNSRFNHIQIVLYRSKVDQSMNSNQTN